MLECGAVAPISRKHQDQDIVRRPVVSNKIGCRTKNPDAHQADKPNSAMLAPHSSTPCKDRGLTKGLRKFSTVM